ncbi:hypothetical protein [Streptomyces sp. NRRL B-24484]|uniref:hypothetical protein n=1 Tax=Streptomyces sp. NRRL B-24484 TaxID=1463833 RepID=UPI0004BEB4A7|nr:hypothetical protein [Streptomyces sp. NRRL B-24484]
MREVVLDMLAAAAPATFPNTTMVHAHEPGPGETGSRALRRAVAFIEADAERPITIARRPRRPLALLHL